MTLIVQFVYVLMAMKSQTAISVFTTVVFVASNRTIEIWIVLLRKGWRRTAKKICRMGNKKRKIFDAICNHYDTN